jgi:hypothetical protein
MLVANMASFQFFWRRFFFEVMKIRRHDTVLFNFKEV